MGKEKHISWETDFNLIREQVNEWDPCGLIESGSPKDEYDSLTFRILSGLINEKSDSEIKEGIIKLLETDFDAPVYSDLKGEKRAKLDQRLAQLIRKIKKRPANNI